MKELQLMVCGPANCVGNNSDSERSERLGDRGYLYTADDYRSSGCMDQKMGCFIRAEFTLSLLTKEKAITLELLKERR